MNKRIRELAEQAGFTVARGWGLKDTVPEDVFIANVCVSNEMKKFAELIVRECIDIVLDSSVEYATRPQVAEELKEHFGVEE
jgi:tRNA nucleotidyltransferase (CCA-adding enzyme)